MNTNQNSNNKAKRNGMLCIWILCWCFVRAFNEHWALFKSIAWQCMMNWSIHDSQSLFSICMHWTVCLFVLHSQILSQYWYMTYAAQWMRKSILLGVKKHNTKVPMNVGNTVKAKQQIESKYFGEKSGRITTHTHTLYGQCFIFSKLIPNEAVYTHTWHAAIFDAMKNHVKKPQTESIFSIWKWHKSWNHSTNCWNNRSKHDRIAKTRMQI